METAGMMMIHSGDAVGCEGGVDVPCWRVERRGGCGVFVRVHFVFGEKKREKKYRQILKGMIRRSVRQLKMHAVRLQSWRD